MSDQTEFAKLNGQQLNGDNHHSTKQSENQSKEHQAKHQANIESATKQLIGIESNETRSNEVQSNEPDVLADQIDGNKTTKNSKKKKKNRQNTNKIGSTEQLNDLQEEKPSENLKIGEQSGDKMNDNVNVNIENVVNSQNVENVENVNIQIDTPSKPSAVKSEIEDLVVTTNNVELKHENDKLLNDDKIDQSNLVTDDQQIVEPVNSNKDQSTEQNGSKSSCDTKTKTIPELLLTENNRPNTANKFLVGALLLFKFVTYFIIKIIELFHPSKRYQLPPINEPLLLLSASEITERIKNGQLKCEHVIRAYINRIELVNPKLNAVIDNCFEDAINRAKEIDEQLKDPKLAVELKKLLLLGVPFTCKDSISIKGLAHTAGVKIRKGIKAEEDATVIKNLKSSGAIPLCLTNTPELVLWCDSDNNLYGRTNNPYDLSRIAGGSSGGEGSLISAAGSLIGIGSDVAGSIRIPAMFNGVFGHKTILKYVPVDGMFPHPPKTYDTFLCYGPFCRYARDLTLALKAMGGDRTDELRLDEPVDFRKIKIYYMEHDGGNPLVSFVDQRILNSMHKVIKYFKEKYGMEVEQININKFKYSLAYFGTVCVKGEMKIEDYVSKTGHLNVYWELFKTLFGKSDITRPILIQILNQSSPYCNPNSSSYKRFTKMLKELKPKVHEMLGDNAVLFMPTWPTLAPKHQTTILRGFDAAYPAIMNAIEVCATHCPVGLSKEEGLPIGFSVAAAPGRDRISIAFAKEIEQAFSGWVVPPSNKQ